MKIAAMCPTATALAKASFNAPSEEIRGIGSVALRCPALYYGTDEALEGKTAFLETQTGVCEIPPLTHEWGQGLWTWHLSRFSAQDADI